MPIFTSDPAFFGVGKITLERDEEYKDLVRLTLLPAPTFEGEKPKGRPININLWGTYSTPEIEIKNNEPDTSDIPEATEEWFKQAKLRNNEPDEKNNDETPAAAAEPPARADDA
jgi:hypothetical protein